MNKYHTLYINASNSIINHLKYIWNDLELKVEFLKGNELSYKYDSNKNINFIKNIQSKVSYILQNTIETEEILTLDHYFGDYFENYSKIIYEIKDTDQTLSRDKQCDNIYTLIHTTRVLIKNLENFIQCINNNCIELTTYSYKDNRVEIINNSLKELTKNQNINNHKKIKIYPMISILGYPCLLLAVFLIIASITIVVVEYSHIIEEANSMVYDSENETYEEYRSRCQEFIITESSKIEKLPSVRITFKLSSISFNIFLGYFIIGNIIIFILKKSKKTDQGFLKYILAWKQLDIGLNLFFFSIKKHVLLILESAELDYNDAYLRLGKLYEIGWLQNKHKSQLTIIDYQNAIDCYKRAFPNKIAIKKYNNLTQKIKEMQSYE